MCRLCVCLSVCLSVCPCLYVCLYLCAQNVLLVVTVQTARHHVNVVVVQTVIQSLVNVFVRLGGQASHVNTVRYVMSLFHSVVLTLCALTV